MSSGDLTNQPPNFLAHFGKDCLGPNVGLVENRAVAMPVRVPDERDAFISWLRGEFAAANAMIDSMCNHLRMVGEPGEYDFALTCIQQRRYNWTVVLHMQQYFSVAEVVYALQQVAWRKQQARNADPSRMQQVRRAAEDESTGSHKGLPSGIRGDFKNESTYTLPSFPLPQFAVVGEAATSRNISQGGSGEVRPINGTEEVCSGEELKLLSRRTHVQSPKEQQLPRSSTVADGTAKELKDLDCSASAPQTLPEDPDKMRAKHEAQTQPENECPISTSKCEDSTVTQLKKKDVQRKGRNSGGMGARLGRAKSLDTGCALFQQVFSTSHTRTQSGSSAGKFCSMDFHLSSKEEEDTRLSMVKVSKQFQCWEQAEGKTINVVDGLELYENVLNNLETSQLVYLIGELQAAGRRGELGGQTFVAYKRPVTGRIKEVIQFGHVFHEVSEDSGNYTMSKDGSAEPMPVIFQALIDRLIRWKILPANKRPDCCSISILEEGDHDPPHMKHHDLERPFCCLSLLAECTFILGHNVSMEQHGDCKGPFRISLPAGSVLTLQGNSADVSRQAIPASPGKRVIVTFAKVLASKVPTATHVGVEFAHTARNTVATTTAWSPVGRQGIGAASGVRGLMPMVVKHYSVAPASGVLPVPSVRPSPHMPQQIPQHLATTSVPPLFTNPTGPAGSYAPVAVMGQGWSAVPRPSRLPSTGTGVFLPSSGSSSGPVRPIAVPQMQPGVIVLSPVSQKADSSVACGSATSEASVSARPSSRTPRHTASSQVSTDQTDRVTEKETSMSSSHISLGSNDPTVSRRTLRKEPVNASPKSEANGNRNTKDEQQNRVSHRPKAGAGSKVHSTAGGSSLVR